MGAIEKAIARFNVVTNPDVAQEQQGQQTAVPAAQVAAPAEPAAQVVAAPAEPAAQVVAAPAEPAAQVVAAPAEPAVQVVAAPAEPTAQVVAAPAEPVAQVAAPAVPLVAAVQSNNSAVQVVQATTTSIDQNSNPSNGKNKTFTLPYKAMELEGLLSLTGPRNQMSEEYRAIKRPILAAIDASQEQGSAHGGRNVVMVTSCVSGEGKTFSAINLALSIALEKDREVLLVDADIANPSAGKQLGFDNDQPGLTELLSNKNRDPEELIWQSDIPNFRVLPAGMASHNATELLSSKNMSELVEGLSLNHPERVIVFDSAPLLLTSEASIVADLAGQIVFVVSAESTTKGMVSDALRIVNDHSRVGFVLNKTRKSQNSLYGYGYGYGYGQTG